MRGALPMPDTPITDSAVQVAPHVASLGALGAAMMGYLPGIIAFIPAIYYGLLIYEGKTVQRWLLCRRIKRRARRIAERYVAKAEAQKQLDLNHPPAKDRTGPVDP